LATDPNHRFASAREMAAALTALAPESFPAALSMSAAGVSGPGGLPGAPSHPGALGMPADPNLDSSWGEWSAPPPSVPGSGTSPGTMDTFPGGAQWVAIPDPDTLGDAEQPGTPADTGATPMPAEVLAALHAQQLGIVPTRWPLALKLAALSFVALALGAGLVFVVLSHDDPPTANAADPQPDPEAAAPAPESSAAATGDDESSDPEATAAAAETAASAEPEAVAEPEPTAEPTAKKKPGKARPKAGGSKPKGTGGKKPQPKPQPKKPAPDPFSERL